MEKLKEKIKNEYLSADIIADFNTAYEMLCDMCYTKGGVTYKESPGSSVEAEELQDDLLEGKMQVDSGIKRITRSIYKMLKVK